MTLISSIHSFALGAQKVPDIWSAPQEKTTYVDRKSQTKQLLEFFEQNLRGTFAITGISGAGKSELAKNYIHRTHDRYDIVWWFDCKREMIPQFHKFAAQWNATFTDPKDEIPVNKLSTMGVVYFIKETLRKTKKSWILVFDNAETMTSLEEYIPTVHDMDGQRKHILITSQNNQSWPHQMHVKEFTEEEAQEYARHRLKDVSPDKVEKAVSVMMHLPFLLDQELEEVASKRVDLKYYLGKADAKMRGQDYKDDRVILIHKKFEGKIDYLKKNNPAAYDALALLSLRQGLALPRPVLAKFLSMRYPTTDLSDVLTVLKSGSFLEEFKGKDADIDLYSLHDIMQKSTRSCLKTKDARAYGIVLAQIMAELLDKHWEDLVRFTNENPETIALGQVVWEISLSLGARTRDIFKLGLTLLEYHLFKTRDHKAYEQVFKDLYAMLPVIIADLPDEVVARFYVDSVFVREIYHDKDMTAEMERHLKRALVLTEKANDKELYLRAIYFTAQHYFSRGDLESAISYARKAEPLLKEVPSRSSKNLYWYLRSWFFVEAGDLAEANYALDQFMATLSEESNTTLKLYLANMKANAYMKEGKFEEGIRWASQAQGDALNYFQTENTEVVAESLMIQGNGYLKLGDYKAAREHLLRSIPIYEIYFGGPDLHSDQAICYRLVGETYMQELLYDKALEYFDRAMNIYVKLYGEDFKNMAEVSSLLILMTTASLKLCREDLVSRILKLHTKNFGISHPGTKQIFEAIDREKAKG